MDVEPIADLLVKYQQTAQAELVEAGYDFIAAGSGEEISEREAIAAWRNFRLRPRVLRDVSTVDTSTSVLGISLPSPVLIAPTAFQSVAHDDGEVEMARGVSAAGSLMVVPTRASTPLAQIIEVLTGPWWFQVYFVRERELTRRMVEDAAKLGAAALVLTGDTPFVGHKRQGEIPPLAPDRYLANFREYLAADAEYVYATSQDPSIGFDVIQWLRDVSGLPVIVKGVLRGDNARACVEAGAVGVIVSNHGGRQLDRALPGALALSEVVDALGDEYAVLVDDGVRSGVDILIALALGARAVLLGRPALWALAAGGAGGVERVLSGLRSELDHAMSLAGVTRIDAIDRTLLSG
jgi:4-hydroxymandelate oxidase